LLTGDGDKSMEAEKALEDAKDMLKGKIVMCKTEIDDGLGERLGEFLGISEDSVPKIILMSFTDNDLLKYFLEGDITKDSII